MEKKKLNQFCWIVRFFFALFHHFNVVQSMFSKRICLHINEYMLFKAVTAFSVHWFFFYRFWIHNHALKCVIACVLCWLVGCRLLHFPFDFDFIDLICCSKLTKKKKQNENSIKTNLYKLNLERRDRHFGTLKVDINSCNHRKTWISQRIWTGLHFEHLI